MATWDLWLCIGQSNMDGRGTAAQSPVPDSALCKQYNYAGGFIALQDPVGTAPYAAQTGSMLPSFAQIFTAASNRPSVFIPMAVGGTALLAANASTNGDWSPTGTRFPNSVTQAQNALDALTTAGHDLGFFNVLIHQGERDAQGGASLSGYEAAYAALVTRYRNALAIPTLKVYAYQIGLGDPDTSDWMTVRNAQASAAATAEGLVMAYDECDEFFTRGWMKADNLHYTQAGLNDMGVKSAGIIAQDLGFTPPPVFDTVPRSRIADRLWMTWQPNPA